MNIDDKDLELVATLEIVINRLQARCKQARARIAAQMRPGMRADAVDPLDATQSFGILLMTKPDKQATVSDRTAFVEWVRTTYPDKVRHDFEVPADPEEIKALFYVHARDRLKDVSVVDKGFEAELLAKSKKFGKPVGPGNELDPPGVMVNTPPSQLRCVPDPMATATLDHLLRSGELDLAALILDDEPAEVPQ